MKTEWNECLLEDCMEAIIDYRGKTPKKTSSGIPLITAKIIKGGSIQPVSEFIAEEDYESWMRRGIPKCGDIVMTTEAPLGEVAQLDGRKVALAQRVITLRGKPGLLDNTFLKYLMSSHRIQHQLEGRATGTTVKGIKQSELRQVVLDFPSFHEQKVIAHILGTLDDKIELNRQINTTLESMAQALFKSWFVDFDPVIDNALAAGNPIPPELAARAEKRKALQASADAHNSTPALPAEIQQRFPSSFVFTEEMGWVPEGWEGSCVGEEFDVTMGQSPPGHTYNESGEGLAFFQGRTDFGFRYPANRIYCTEPKRIATKGDTLVSVRAPVGDVNMAADDCCIGRGVSASRHKSGSGSYTYYAMRQLRENFKVYEGEGTVFGSINQKNFKALPQLKVPLQLVQAFETFAGGFDKKIELISANVEALTQIRDSLLPKLLSGQLQIPEAEQQLVEVV